MVFILVPVPQCKHWREHRILVSRVSIAENDMTCGNLALRRLQSEVAILSAVLRSSCTREKNTRIPLHDRFTFEQTLNFMLKFFAEQYEKGVDDNDDEKRTQVAYQCAVHLPTCSRRRGINRGIEDTEIGDGWMVGVIHDG
jgi:hypothetical protein